MKTTFIYKLGGTVTYIVEDTAVQEVVSTYFRQKSYFLSETNHCRRSCYFFYTGGY